MKSLLHRVAVAAAFACTAEPAAAFRPVRATFTVSEFQPRIRWSGRVNAIAINSKSEDEVFVTTESGGLFKSLDGGQTWAHVDSLPASLTNDVAYAGNDSQVIFVTASRDYSVVRLPGGLTTSNGGIWVSRDGGETWERPATAVPFTSLSNPAICPEDYSAFGISVEPVTNRVYVATDCAGVSVSDDNGLSWSHVVVPAVFVLPPGVTPVQAGQTVFTALAALGEGRVIAGGQAGVFYSTDGGRRWSLEQTGIRRVRSDNGNLHRDVHIHSIAASPQAGEAYLVNERTELYRTRNGGRNWERIPAPLGSDDCGGTAFVKAVQLERQPGPTVFLGNRCLAFQSFDVSRAVFWFSLGAAHGDARDIAFGGWRLDIPPFGFLRFAIPRFLANDGGLERLREFGSNWVGGQTAGSGPGRLNALQVTEVTGQRIGSTRSDLAFGTQDNDLWASPDGGRTWPAFDRAEGFSIELERAVEREEDSRMTYTACAGCATWISGPLFRNRGDWLDPLLRNGKAAPVLVERGTYLQHSNDIRLLGFGLLFLTRTYSTSWSFLARIPEEFRGHPKIAGPRDNPVAYQALRVGSLFEDVDGVRRGFEKVGLLRLTGFLGAAPRSTTLRYPAMRYPDTNGVPECESPSRLDCQSSSRDDCFGSLGVMPTMFAWYWVFAVDPQDAMHLIAPDAGNGRMAESWDGGCIWNQLPVLTDLVTKRGALSFVDKSEPPWYYPLVSTIKFHPDNPNLVLLGAREGGAYFSHDRGRRWQPINGSEQMVNITSFHWRSLNEAIVSTYGRGLWKIGLRIEVALQELVNLCGGCQRIPLEPGFPGEPVPRFPAAEPQSQPFDAAFLVLDGRILDAKIEGGVLREVSLSPEASHIELRNPALLQEPVASTLGQLTTTQPPVETPTGGALVTIEQRPVSDDLPPAGGTTPLPIVTEVLGDPPDVGVFEGLPVVLPSDGVVVGFTSLDGRVNGVLVADKEIPIPAPGPEVPFEDTGEPTSEAANKPYIALSARSMIRGLPVLRPGKDELVVRGRDFDPSSRVDILIDGQLRRKAMKIGPSGRFVARLRVRLAEGPHQVLARQSLGLQDELLDVSTFLVQHEDNPGEKEEERRRGEKERDDEEREEKERKERH